MATVEELQKCVDEIQRQHDIISMENDMLAAYLQRDADRHAEVDDAEEDQSPSQMDKGGLRKQRSVRGARGAGQRQQRPLPQSLTLEEKFQIANQEVEALKKDTNQLQAISEQNMDVLKAMIEETDIRTAEVKRDAYEFRRDIVVGAEDPRTGKTMAERVMKYMEDKLTQKDQLIYKLAQKSQTYKQAIRKAEQQLKAKKETGDELQFIDFHQQKIENQQFVKRIEMANQEHLDLKRRSGRTVKILNNRKKKLSSLSAEAKLLEAMIKERKASLDKMEHDIVKVVEEKEVARKECKKLRDQSRGAPEMPQVVDYVAKKVEQAELEAQKKNWERKLEIVERAARAVRRQESMEQTQRYSVHGHT